MDEPSLYAVPPASTISLTDCSFYHSMTIPGFGEVKGAWDLRETVDDYLGRLDFGGKRVLEIGPASGFLTMEMERRGADIVAVEIPEGMGWDFVPLPETVLAPIRAKRIAGIPTMKNGFWQNHIANHSKAKVAYADVYNLPNLGQFDIAVLASVLLHCRSPVSIIEQCSTRAKTILITERHFPELYGPICRLVPSEKNAVWDTWWSFTPEFFTQYLSVLGCRDTRVSFHAHCHTPSLPTLIPMFSVVGTR